MGCIIIFLMQAKSEKRRCKSCKFRTWNWVKGHNVPSFFFSFLFLFFSHYLLNTLLHSKLPEQYLQIPKRKFTKNFVELEFFFLRHTLHLARNFFFRHWCWCSCTGGAFLIKEKKRKEENETSRRKKKNLKQVRSTKTFCFLPV